MAIQVEKIITPASVAFTSALILIILRGIAFKFLRKWAAISHGEQHR